MPDWGLSETGFYRPRFDEIRVEMEARWRGRFGANRNTSHSSVDGHFIDFTSEAMAMMFEAAEGAYNAAFLDTAGGTTLDQWASSHGFERQAATQSTVTLLLSGADGLVVPAGRRVRLVDSGEIWTLDDDVTFVGNTEEGAFTAVNSGAIAAEAGSDWAIVDVVTGWTGATNAADAEVGDERETDAEFRARIRAGMRAGGIAAALFKLEGVESVTIFQNDTDVPDGLYGETHWVEAMVVGGDDTEIALAIARWKGEGIGTQGNTTVALPFIGGSISFTRPTEVDFWIEADITAGEGFATGSSAESTIAGELVRWANENHATGDDVAPDMFRGRISAVASGRFSAVLRIDDVDPPVNTGIHTVADRSVARFDTSRTTVTIA
jgi:uncharacterized phage protein gp47/JayE